MTRKEYDEVCLVIYGYKCFGEAHYAEEFFQMIIDANPALLPQKIGIADPMRIAFSMEAAKKLWIESESEREFNGGGIIFKNRKTDGSIRWNNKDNSSIIWLTIPRNLVIANDLDSRAFITRKAV